MKICTKCIKTKDLKLFPKAIKHISGRGSWCRECVNSHKRDKYKEHRDEHLSRHKKWRLENINFAKKREKEWRDKNKDYAKGKLLQKYWPSATWREALANFNILVAKQNNVCAICGMPETRPSKKGSKKSIRDLCVDHCHETGKVRGLLCDKCNSLLGNARDNYIICISAAGYLKRALNEAIS